MNGLKSLVRKYNDTSLILRIVIGIIAGIVLAFLVPSASAIGILGDLFVGALKALAPVLVAVLVMSSLCQGGGKLDRRFGMVIFLYMLTTLLAAFAAVVASFLFPQTLTLVQDASAQAAPGNIVGIVVPALSASISSSPMRSR